MYFIYYIKGTLWSMVLPRDSDTVQRYEYRWKKDYGRSRKCWISGKGGSTDAHHGFNYINPLFVFFRFARWNKFYIKPNYHRMYHSEFGKIYNTIWQLLKFRRAVRRGLFMVRDRFSLIGGTLNFLSALSVSLVIA